MSLPDVTPDLSGRVVAVLGLGAMGLPMATNLARHGATVRGYDIAQARLDLASAAGVAPSAGARPAARLPSGTAASYNGAMLAAPPGGKERT